MRYYAQYTEVPEIFACKHNQAWMIFDRNIVTPQGEVRPILLATNRYVAFDTRDALNAQEERK